MNSPITLGIDTTGPCCSLALLRGLERLAVLVDPAVGSAERFLPLLQSLLRSTALTLDDLERISVCSGPGSFTGIRTGFASAQGIAFARKLPVLGVSSLLCRLLPQLMAMPLATATHFVPMIKAREGEYYRCELQVIRREPERFDVVATEVGVGEDLPVDAIVLDETERGGLAAGAGQPGAELAAASFELCRDLLIQGTAHGLCQLSSGGSGLLPLYVKAVNARTLEERFGKVGGGVVEIR